MTIALYQHQIKALEKVANFQNVAFFHDMGLGKTFTGFERLKLFDNDLNVIVCQKSMMKTWYNHAVTNGKMYDVYIYSKLKKKAPIKGKQIFIINYDLIFRRPEFIKLRNFTLILDESSEIKNDKTKRCKFIMKMNPKNVILLSGSPISGKYEFLYSQLKMLGDPVSKHEFMNTYTERKMKNYGGCYINEVVGYKNIDNLKDRLIQNGAQFLKTEECFELPEKNFFTRTCENTNEYRKFIMDRVITIKDKELIGDNSLSKLTYARMLCGAYNNHKTQMFCDILNSASDRLVVFYTFNIELEKLKDICVERPVSIINGQEKNLDNYEVYDNSVSLIQYKAGSMGLNLQKANKIIFFTPPLSSEYFMQSKKRIHRIGQEKTCYYYKLIAEGSVEEKIYESLEKGEDYTNFLFDKDFSEKEAKHAR